MTQSPNQKQKEKISKQVRQELGELKPQEIELIYLIRNLYKFGRIEIETRDGLPQNIVKTVDRQRLGDFTKLSPTQ